MSSTYRSVWNGLATLILIHNLRLFVNRLCQLGLSQALFLTRLLNSLSERQSRFLIYACVVSSPLIFENACNLWVLTYGSDSPFRCPISPCCRWGDSKSWNRPRLRSVHNVSSNFAFAGYVNRAAQLTFLLTWLWTIR